jgi:hypothetical protein
VQSDQSGLQQSHHKKTKIEVCRGAKAGMVTTLIVQPVHNILQQTSSQMVSAKIIFPVSSEAVMSMGGDSTTTREVALVAGVVAEKDV